MKKRYLEEVLSLDRKSPLYKYLDDNFDNFTLAGFVDYLKDSQSLALLHIDKSGEKKEATYETLSIDSNKMANYLRKKGIKKHDVVALVLRNNYEFFITILALQKLGAVAMPLQYTNKERQYKSIFERANPTCVIAEDYEIKQSNNHSVFVLNELDKACNKNIIKVCTNANSDYSKKWYLIDNYRKESIEFTNEKVKIEDLGYLFSTSGTTGQPKLVMHNYGFALAHYFTGEWYGLEKEKKHLTICDSGWAMSSWNMSAVLLHQATLYVNDYDRFNAGYLLKCLEEEKINTLCAPRSILMLLVNELEKENKEYNINLKSISSAGEPMDKYDKSLIENTFKCYVKEGYGMTEIVLPLYENDNKEQQLSPLYEEMHIEPIKGLPNGEIVVKGGKIGLLMGYLDCNKEYVLYKTPPVENGLMIWHTSDSGHIDNKGKIHCDGRIGNTVKVNDCLVNKSEVEHVIRSHPQVLDCIVESKKNNISGNSLTAYVELKENMFLDKKEIKEYVKSKLPDYCRPKEVVFQKLERTENGKVKRNDLIKTPNKYLVLKKANNLDSI